MAIESISLSRLRSLLGGIWRRLSSKLGGAGFLASEQSMPTSPQPIPARVAVQHCRHCRCCRERR